MTESTNELLRWAFEGVGGAAVVGLAGWLWHAVTSEPKHPASDPLRSKQVAKAIGGDANISESNRAGVEASSTLQNSPVIAGSNNTVHYYHKTNEDADDLSWVGGAVVSLVLLLGLCAAFYFALHETNAEGPVIHPSPALAADPNARTSPAPAVNPNGRTSPGLAASPKARAEVGLAFSDRLSSRGFGVSESESCVTEGVTCLGEGKIKDKAITVPLQRGTNWQRIVVLVSTFDAGEFDLDNPHVVVSTTSADVGLSYASHRDGESRKRLEFTDELFLTTEYNRPDSFTLDIELGSRVESFPLKVEVWAKGLPHHVVNFTVCPRGGPA